MDKKVLAAAFCAAALGGLTAGSAFAGEVTGTGESTPIRSGVAASECAFSGQNDDPEEAFPFGGRVQSFGRLVAQLGPLGGVPGEACNPARAGE
jgi:hypothetical protein